MFSAQAVLTFPDRSDIITGYLVIDALVYVFVRLVDFLLVSVSLHFTCFEFRFMRFSKFVVKFAGSFPPPSILLSL